MTDSKRTKAVIDGQNALRAALTWTSPDLRPDALTRERARRIEAAREPLRALLPAESAAGDTAERVARLSAEALAGLEAHDADSVAVVQNEQRKLQRALGPEKQHLDAVIRAADRRRLAALMDDLDELVAGSADEAGARAEVSALIIDRLAALGDAKAREAQSEAAAGATTAAWGAAVAQVIERGDLTYNVAADLYRADPEAHDAIQAADPMTPGLDLSRAIRQAEQAAAVAAG